MIERALEQLDNHLYGKKQKMKALSARDYELYNKAVTTDWSGRQMLWAIAAAREEGRQEERARWLAWATDLGFDRQEIPAEVRR